MPTIKKRALKELESSIQAKIRQWCATQPDIALWRNNVGKLQDRFGTWVTYGLCEGSADLVGFLRCTVHPTVNPLLRVTCARFLAIEVKRPGQSPSDEQAAWLRLVRENGGVAGVCYSVDDAISLIEDGRAWL